MASRRKQPIRTMNGRMRRKLAALFCGVVLVLIGLIGRITYINAENGDQYARQVLAQSQGGYGSTTLPFKRGDILDANGLTLATSEKRYHVILDCKVVNSSEAYLEPTVEALETVFDIDTVGVRALLSDEKTASSQYQVILRNITVEQKAAWSSYKKPDNWDDLTAEQKKEKNAIQGVWFEETYVRVYPYGALACDVIGFTNGDNSADWGIEGYYSNTLNGVDGRKFGHWDDNDDLTQTIIQPRDGQSVVTTLDANIQQILEKEIAHFNEAYKDGPYNTGKGAQNVGVIVMDPNNGEILGMASSDSYDLNNPRDLTSFYAEEALANMSDEDKVAALQAIWRNYCISDAYEPGSVFKPVTMAAALESGTLTGSETYDCDGGENVSGTYIKCSEVTGHGLETNSDVIRNSCNDAMMQIAAKMGVDSFCDYQQLFNFGSRTGIDLSGEASGLLFDPATMGSVDLATSSFGQGFTCTMIQEAAAVASVINGGYYYQPHLVSRILNAEGKTVKTIEPVLLKQTVSNEVSEEVRSYMKAAVEGGSAIYSKVNGYSMGGKTGTAQKLPRGNGKYLVSYIGFAPADEPQVLIYVVIDEPNIANQDDSRFPQWIANNVLTEILPYLNIFPDEALTEPDPTLFDPSYADERNGAEGEEAVPDPDNAENDTPADTNVPAITAPDTDRNEDPEGGNTPEDDGVTNDEAARYE